MAFDTTWMRRRVWLLVLVGGGALLFEPVAAQGTTGPDALSEPPIYKPTAAEAKPFLGRYALTTPDRDIIASTLRTGYNRFGYLEGSISVTQYDGSEPATWLATLYEYRRRGSQMKVDVWIPGRGSAPIGHLAVRRTDGGGLTGTLKLVGSAPTAVTYERAGRHATKNRTAGTQTRTTDAQTSSSEKAGIFATAVAVAELLEIGSDPDASP